MFICNFAFMELFDLIPQFPPIHPEHTLLFLEGMKNNTVLYIV